MLLDDGSRCRPPHSTSVRALIRRLQKQDGGAFEQDRAHPVAEFDRLAAAGAAMLTVAGVIRRAAAGPAGLIALADNEFGSGLTVPMTPSSRDKTV